MSTPGPPATRASTSAARQPPRPIAPDGALPALQPAHTGKASKDMSAAQKAAMRKERNRLAAQRSRDKRQHEYEAVAAERDRWKAEADSLRAKVRQLEALLKKKSGPPPDAAVPAEVSSPVLVSGPAAESAEAHHFSRHADCPGRLGAEIPMTPLECPRLCHTSF